MIALYHNCGTRHILCRKSKLWSRSWDLQEWFCFEFYKSKFKVLKIVYQSENLVHKFWQTITEKILSNVCRKIAILIKGLWEKFQFCHKIAHTQKKKEICLEIAVKTWISSKNLEGGKKTLFTKELQKKDKFY